MIHAHSHALNMYLFAENTNKQIFAYASVLNIYVLAIRRCVSQFEMV